MCRVRNSIWPWRKAGHGCMSCRLACKTGMGRERGWPRYSKGTHGCRLTFQTALALLNSRRPHKSQRKACIEDLSEVLRRLKAGGLSLHVTRVKRLAWQHKRLQQRNMVQCTHKLANVQTFPQELFVWMQVLSCHQSLWFNTQAKCIQICLKI